MSTAEATATEETEDNVRGLLVGGKVYESPGDFTLTEAKVIKAQTGMTPQELILTVRADPTDPDALEALAWTVLSRDSSKPVEWDDPRIGKSSIAEFFVLPDEEEEADANPPASRRKRSS